MYRYGLKGWLQLVYRDGWKCMSTISPPAYSI